MPKKAVPQITGQEYTAFDQAYAYCNTVLFSGKLRPCLITLQRQARSYGYFAVGRFQDRTVEVHTTDELALNPDTFAGRSDTDMLSTLVHEMVHCWQQHFGTPPLRGYHDRAWAVHMVAIGLMPADTGAPGGKQTGQHMGHDILPGKPFDRAAAVLLATDFRLHWQSLADKPQHNKLRSKTKYQCPVCEQNAWAKPTAQLFCGLCKCSMGAMRSAWLVKRVT